MSTGLFSKLRAGESNPIKGNLTDDEKRSSGLSGNLKTHRMPLKY